MSFVAVTANAGRVDPSRRPGTLQENTRREGIRHWHHKRMPQCSAAQRAHVQLANTRTASTASLYSIFFLWNTQSPPTHLMMAKRLHVGVARRRAHIDGRPQPAQSSVPNATYTPLATKAPLDAPAHHVRVFLFVETMCGVPASAPHDVLRRHTSGEAPVPEIRSQSNNGTSRGQFK